MKLPSKKGERVTVLERFEDQAEGPSRIVLTSDGRGRWSMSTESAYRCEADDEGAEEWTDSKHYLWDASAGVAPAALKRVMIDLALALRKDAGFYLRPEVTPAEPSITDDGENVVAKIRGNRCLIVDNHGSSYTGEPIVAIRTNKPFDPGQWLAALGNLAKAIDAYDREFGDD